MYTLAFNPTHCLILVALSLIASVAYAAPPQRPMLNPKEVHNLRSTTTDCWIIYSWTDAKSYRSGEPISLSLRFITETTGEFEMPTVALIILDSDGKVVITKALAVKPTAQVDGILNLYHWRTTNVIPDSTDPNKSELRTKGKYTASLELKYKDGAKYKIDNFELDIGR